MSRFPHRGFAALFLCLVATDVFAQTAPDVSELSLQELLNAEVVSSASKFPQEVREAPASITVITADEIRRQGHRTLVDVLQSVRGLYSSYDRNYEYVGIRGFSRPGDYNTRILLLVDGHRLNDGVYDMASVGTDFPIDISLIDRVEVVRGPISSLYGTSAFFAVINVVTRTGVQRRGVQAETYAGSLSTRGANVSFGRLFGDGDELLIAASGFRSAGAERLYFPEFADSPSSGVATGLDGDRSSKVFGSYEHGRVSIRGALSYRNKDVPTASFATVFADGREATTDTRGFMNVVFDSPLGRGWSATARLAYDVYTYSGDYPYDYGDGTALLARGLSSTHTVSGEVTTRRRVGHAHLIATGVEVRNQFHANLGAADAFQTLLDVNHPGTTIGLYAQDEMRLTPWLIVNGGARFDQHPAFGSHVAPRIGLVLLPSDRTAIKVLHGDAFRAPNAYELYFYRPMRELGLTLEPEHIASTELVWQQFLSKHVRTTLSVFEYDADRLIEQRSIAGGSADDLYFTNSGDVIGRGIEAEVETRLANGFTARASHAISRIRDHSTDSWVSNSPQNLSKIALQVPLWHVYLGAEGQFVGERRTLDGGRLPAFFAPNATLTTAANRRVDASLSVYNALDRAYADPAAKEHAQRAIPQDGRTMLARIRFRF
jgi:iron complex outermembrane receptor protein